MLSEDTKYDYLSGSPKTFRAYRKSDLAFVPIKGIDYTKDGEVECYRSFDGKVYGPEDLHVMQWTGFRDVCGERIFCHDVILTQPYKRRNGKKVRDGREQRFMALVAYRIYSGSGFYDPSEKKHGLYLEYDAVWRAIKEKAFKEDGWEGGGWSGFWRSKRLGSIYDKEFEDARSGEFREALQGWCDRAAGGLCASMDRVQDRIDV